MPQRTTTLPITLALLISISGCGQDPPRRLRTGDGRILGHVIGWVTLDGKPLAGAQVDFMNKVTRRSSSGTDENGRYELKFNRKLRGAPTGDHSVRIGLFGNDAADPAAEPLPAIYNANTILKTTVREGYNVINFHLTTPGAGQVAELGPVVGLVLLDGKPLVGARVEFTSEKSDSGSGSAIGMTDKRGRYQLVFTEKRPGAAIGHNHVRVFKPDANGKETLRPLYNAKTMLSQFVESEKNDFPISLTSIVGSGAEKTPQPKVPSDSR
ncbi:MAG: hypothetical protein QF363_16535 [Planctomycetaceae bacterium]|jgi:hypothetical protein|nr:hypothetical protein [Planctomycetaceae bacterium]